ncbi:lysophosphatidic acid receptor 5b [Spinachia spinachia]
MWPRSQSQLLSPFSHSCAAQRRATSMLNVTLENAGERNWRSPAYAALFGSVVALGLPFNAASLWILVRRHSLRSPCVIFMVNLAVSDLMLVVTLSTRVYFYTTGTWSLGHMACIWITMLFRNNIRSSSIFITFISVDRLLAVVYPLRSRHLRTAFNAWRATALVWFCVITVNVEEGIKFSQFLNLFNASTCFEFNHSPEQMSAMAYFQPALVLTMLAVNIVSTALVSVTLHTRSRVLAGIKNPVNVILIFAMNLAMFAVFFVPVSMVVFFQKSSRSAITPLVGLASVNCCLDPLLYYFSFDGFWKRKEDVDTCASGE